MTKQTIREMLVEDFRCKNKTVLSHELIDKIQNQIKDAETGYLTNGSLASAVFYVRVKLSMQPGDHNFTGNAGGIFTPGGGALFGTLFTDNLANLIANAESFELHAAAAYTGVLFFDSSSNLLGHFESGSVSTVVGTGGGTGSWD